MTGSATCGPGEGGPPDIAAIARQDARKRADGSSGLRGKFHCIQASTNGVLSGHNRRSNRPLHFGLYTWAFTLGDLPLVAASTPVEITWLIAAVAKGDPSALERLYEATCAKLYGVVLRIVRRHDLAADVIEESYLQIWRSAGEFNPGHSSPIAWMVAIARRMAIDVARGAVAADG